MAKYLVFCCYKYYPSGGWEDFRFEADTLEECFEKLAIEVFDFYHIVDTNTREIVKAGSRNV